MANLSRLDQKKWLNLFLSKNEKFIKEIVFYKWPSLFDIPKFNCKVSLEINHLCFDGFGMNSDRSLSLIIAISEAIERYQWHKRKQDSSTNGYANHFCLERASQASLSEVYERDLVLSHFLTKTPYIPLEFSKDILEPWQLRLINNKTYPFKVFFYQTHSINQQFSTICMLKHKESHLGVTFGCKSHLNLKQAIEGSFLDALSRFHLLFIHHEEKNNHEGPTKYLAADYFELIKFLFPKEKNVELKNDNISLSTSYSQAPDFLALSHQMFSTFVNEKEKIQNLYKNAPTTMNINIKRLKQFNPHFNPSNINTLENPFY